MPNIPAPAFTFLTVQILKQFEMLRGHGGAKGLYDQLADDMSAQILTKLIKGQPRGFSAEYFGYRSNPQTQGKDFRDLRTNLRGCMIHYFKENKFGTHADYAHEKDTCVRQLWRNLADFAVEHQSVSLSDDLLELYRCFIQNDAIWEQFEQKRSEVPDPIAPANQQNWYSFHCFFSGEDTDQKVLSFHLLIDVQPRLSVMECKILYSPQKSSFNGTITIAASRHYATVDLHSGRHHRPLRIIFELPDTEAELPQQGEMSGVYALINKQGERLHRGEMIITCNIENSQKEAEELIALSPHSYQRYSFPAIPQHITSRLKQTQQPQQPISSTLAPLGLLCLPEYFTQTAWKLILREDDSIDEHLFYINQLDASGLHKVELLVVQSTYEDYIGFAGFDREEKWLIANLSTKKSGKNFVHIKVGVPPAANTPTLLIGQISYISTENSTRINTDLIILEKITVDAPFNSSDYIKEAPINSDAYHLLPEEYRKFFANIDYTRLRTPSLLVANPQEFKDKLPLLMPLRMNRSELSISLPDAFMGQNFYLHTVEEPVVNQPGIIVKAVLHFSGNKGEVTVKNPQGYEMAHWDGIAYASNGGTAIHLLLHSQKRSTLHPTLHIVFHIPAGETFVYPDNIPNATKYYTGAYLLFTTKGKITAGTVVLSHIANANLIPEPSVIKPTDKQFNELDAQIKQFFQHKSNNTLSIPKIFSTLDWENFFAENENKQFAKIKKIPGGKWVYLAAPASQLDENMRNDLQKLLVMFKTAIEEQFGVQVFAPFLDAQTVEARAGMIEGSQDIIRHIRKSDRMIMFYPSASASTCLIELGMALTDHHKIHVFYNDSEKMPFLLRDLAHSNRITDTSYSEQHIKDWLKYAAKIFFS